MATQMPRCEVTVPERDDSQCPNIAVNDCGDCGEALCEEHIGRELDMSDVVLCKRCSD